MKIMNCEKKDEKEIGSLEKHNIGIDTTSSINKYYATAVFSEIEDIDKFLQEMDEANYKKLEISGHRPKRKSLFCRRNLLSASVLILFIAVAMHFYA